MTVAPWLIWIILFLTVLIPTNVYSISYRCENNQVLVVQSFGNDTIRMHCQKLSLCGSDGLTCNYEREQPSCGGKKNFVAHVNQITPTGPVAHTCCEVANSSPESVPGHDANDCFVYELPDGTPPTDAELAKFNQNSVESENDQYTLLKNAQQVPQEFDGYVGYRMRLFMLKNKAPPMLIVKAIERLPEGYRVTICRPLCNKYNREEKVKHDERTEITGDVEGSLKPDEWAAAAWSSWSERKKHNYTITKWSNWTRTKDPENRRITIQGDQFLPNAPSDVGDTNNIQRSNHSNNNTHPNLNINVAASGGAGGIGGTNIAIAQAGSIPGSGDGKGSGNGVHGSETGSNDADGKKTEDDFGDGNELSNGKNGKPKSNRNSKESEPDDNSKNGHSKFGSKETNGIQDGDLNGNGLDGDKRGNGNGNGNKDRNKGVDDGSDNQLPNSNGDLLSNQQKHKNNDANGKLGDKNNGGIDDDDYAKNRTIHVNIGPDDGNETYKKGRFGTHDVVPTDGFAKIPMESEEQHKAHGGRIRNGTGASQENDNGSGNGNDAEKDKVLKHRMMHKNRNGTASGALNLGEKNRPSNANGSGGGSSAESVLSANTTINETDLNGDNGKGIHLTDKTNAKPPEIDRNTVVNKEVGQTIPGKKGPLFETLASTVKPAAVESVAAVNSGSSASQGSNPQAAAAPTQQVSGGGEQASAAAPAQQASGGAEQASAAAPTQQGSGGGEQAAAAAPAQQASGGGEQASATNDVIPMQPFVQSDATGSSGTSSAGAADPSSGQSSGGSGDVMANLMKMNCFSGDTVVRTASGYKPMKELEVGDMVLVPASKNLLKYEKVEMFYHRDHDKTVQFLTMYTKSGKSLSLTALHLLPFGNCREMQQEGIDIEKIQEIISKSRFANKAKIGDCLLSINDEGKLYVDEIIGRKVSNGIYSPMTVEGSIIANDILTSCFSHIESHSIQKIAYDLLIGIYKIFGYMQDYTYGTLQKDIPSMLNHVHELSGLILPFAKY